MAIHMQEADAVRNFAKVMEHVRAGNDVMLEHDGQEVAIVKHLPRTKRPVRGLSQALGALASFEVERGAAIGDADFEADLVETHRRWNKPLDGSRWD